MLQRMLALLILALVVAACNGPASSLTVTNLVPTDGAEGVLVNTTVSATFNLGIDVDTLDGAFTLMGDGEIVEGIVTTGPNARRATFTPNAPLAFGTEYTATVAGTVATTDGVALGGPASWSFTTVAQPSDALAFADPSVTAYETVDDGVATIGDQGEITLTFPAVVNAVGNRTYTLMQADGSPDLLRTIETYEFDPPWDPGNLIPAATYGLELDADGTITGRTPFPGTYTGIVRLTDGAGRTLEAPYEIVLEYTAAYLVDDTTIVVTPGDAGADPDDRFILVPGDRVTIAGANPLAFGAVPPGEPTLIAGTERVFRLERVSGNGGEGIIEINGFDGTISAAELSVVPGPTAQTWVYDVVVEHGETEQEAVAERFTFTLVAD